MDVYQGLRDKLKGMVLNFGFHGISFLLRAGLVATVKCYKFVQSKDLWCIICHLLSKKGQ